MRLHLFSVAITISLLFHQGHCHTKRSKASKASKARSQVYIKGWREIKAPDSFEYALPTGEVRTYHPSCSGGPVVDPVTGNISPANTQYSFYFKPGKKYKKLLVFFQGGGMCHNADLCIDSLLQGNPTYQTHVQAEEELGQGIFDDDNADNTFRHYNKLYLPFCTGDIFSGSRDTEYTLDNIKWTIHHRGIDNFLSAFDWLSNNAAYEEGFYLSDVKDVAIVGSSAGAYGVAAGFPYLAELVRKDIVFNLISDSTIAVATTNFLKTAMFNPDDPSAPTSWGTTTNLPTWAGIDEAVLADVVSGATEYGALYGIYNAMYVNGYRDFNLGLYSSNMDPTMIRFYTFVLFYDGISYSSDAEYAKVWYVKIINAVNKFLSTMPNVRVLLEEAMSNGAIHQILPEHEFYNTGASGVSVNEWVKCMVTNEDCWKTIILEPALP